MASFISQYQGKILSSAEFVDIFKKYDKDGNGFIEAGELDSLLEDLITIKGEKVEDFQSFKKSILNTYDSNSDNKISLKELAGILPTEDNFLAKFRDANLIHIADFMKIWYHYDQDKSGYLENNELKGFLHDLLSSKSNKDSLEAGVSASQVDNYSKVILDLFDKNRDGKIELSELSKILPVEESFFKNLKNDGERLTEEQFEKLFSHYDQDGNGYIEDTELLGFLKDLLQSKSRDPTTTDLEQYRARILEISDTDKDGRLSKSELKLLLL